MTQAQKEQAYTRSAIANLSKAALLNTIEAHRYDTLATGFEDNEPRKNDFMENANDHRRNAEDCRMLAELLKSGQLRLVLGELTTTKG